ncbi:threonine/serine dehydratase [Trinickia caryophylli]|uniref:L-threonine ammonia-lyase n=1 Tax=Trinickia caryophylli TaxID=28094 RepID=A0A1X7CNP5_TRICW|nr:threonine/serine dehydratase [Trinickia caryophylli]PMS11258.1 threonine/serine dehydratase [Trinickia caryophylli]TRX20111.1 threonine/serine dehydratase [Trinickia caryophylli]WQE12539.1 threonine/serine dehydratase [Trinickia caryophylli]SME99851.1 L-threonine ammonia-lyase [Trinickia caryophylli]GLU30224.1 serine/threonine dehydratase [Trinickia caryophylli]
MITHEAIRMAAQRIAPYIRTTPVVRLEDGWFGVPGETFLKLESLQVTGSFKPRGAFNRLLSERLPAAGVIAASGGNHGIAIAYAAQKLGARAEIYVPSLATELKRKILTELGARVVVAGNNYVEALAASDARAAETGALNVHAFDHAATVAGQGTLAIELDAQVPDVDTVLVSVGGGGFIGGIAAWFGGRVKVVAVEPTQCPTLNRALLARMPVDVDTAGIAADSLGCRRIGDVPFSILLPTVRDTVLVSDEQIRGAQRALWENFRIAAEPGGATAFAALVSGVYARSPGEKIAVVICGGNADPASFA